MASANCASTTLAPGAKLDLFSPRERAALALTDVLTRLPEGGVADDLYQRVQEQFGDREISDLTFVIAEANAWNRLSIAARTKPGSADAKYGLLKAGLN